MGPNDSEHFYGISGTLTVSDPPTPVLEPGSLGMVTMLAMISGGWFVLRRKRLSSTAPTR
jgi:hypothetical protein